MAINGIDRFEQIDLQLFETKRRDPNPFLANRVTKRLACVYGPHIIGTYPYSENTGFALPLAFVQLAARLQHLHYQDFPHVDETSRRLQALHQQFMADARNRHGVAYPYNERVFPI